MKQLALLMFAVIMMACESEEMPVEETVNDSNTEEVSIPDGEFIEYYSNGSIKAKGAMMNGQRISKWISYYPSGAKASENMYARGVLTGKTVTYFENGLIRYIGYYENSERAGVWQLFNEKGEQTQQIDYTKE